MPIGTVARGVFHILHEAARHLRRRPAMAIAVAIQAQRGQCLLVRRVDQDEWMLPGGPLLWGETLRECVARHVRDAGVAEGAPLRIVGVDSRQASGAELHVVMLVVTCSIGDVARATFLGPGLAEARFFERAELPPLPARACEMLEAAFGASAAFVE